MPTIWIFMETILSFWSRLNYFFRRKISGALKLKNIPQIKFVIDKSLQNALDIEVKLREDGKNYPTNKE